MSEKTVDLHGIEKQPFPNFDEDATYLEAVTLGRVQATALLRDQGFDTRRLKRVWMRWATGEEARNNSSWHEMDECWLECGQTHPDAVPFWKDGLDA